MRKYETVLVINPDLSEVELKEEIRKIEQQLTQFGGMDIKVDRWGKRELGYEMKKRKTGYYLLVTFQSEKSDLMDNITGLLRINDNVLKFQSHRLSDKVRKFRGNPRKVASEGSDLDSGDSDFVTA